MNGTREKAYPARLKSGVETKDIRLDRVDEKDPRSRRYTIAAITPPHHYRRFRSYTWSPGPTLDQGSEGACVGFAWAHELAARPAVVKGLTTDFAGREIYFAAQKCDRFPGGAYPGALPFVEGTSVLGGAKAVNALGYISEYRWAFDFWDLVAAVGYRGPAIFGCSWFSAMHTPDTDGFVSPTGSLRGGHCIAVIGVRIIKNKTGEISLEDSYFRFQNSWGPDWGIEGFGKIRFNDMLRLWKGAETCIPVVRHRRPSKDRQGTGK
jgi:hypothetical protein